MLHVGDDGWWGKLGNVGTGGGRQAAGVAVEAGQAGEGGGAVLASAEAGQEAEAGGGGRAGEVVGEGGHHVGLRERVGDHACSGHG